MTVAGGRGSFDDVIPSVIAAFGQHVWPRLTGRGEQEAQLYGPLETVFERAAHAAGLEIVVHPQTPLPEYRIKPDFALKVAGGIVGYVEVKQPRKGADPDTFRGRDRFQWERLKLLPNVLYTDGLQWSLYRNGNRVGDIARPFATAARQQLRLTPDAGGLAPILHDFLCWEPEEPRRINQLVNSTAVLCRLLREEVREALRLERSGVRRKVFSLLADDWRSLLFPEADENDFVDGYAQTVTFALLTARDEDISFTGSSIHDIARQLGQRQSLMGKTLQVLVDGLGTEFDLAITTLVRILENVDWKRIEDRGPDMYLRFYETFLKTYDAAWRQRMGAYYTPRDLVSFQVGFTEELLQRKLQQPRGYASPDVTVVDPAMGTGSYLAEIMDVVAETVQQDEGDVAASQLRSLASRLIGIERQIGPFAVSQWRIHRALREYGALEPDEGMRLYVSDTLATPDENELRLPSAYRVIAKSKRDADEVKLNARVLVVIGNPPSGERARRRGSWVETRQGPDGRAPLDDFREPGNGRQEHKLSNLYVYFWRWGCWKVFDAHPDSPAGIVTFISTSGYLAGPGFAGMRRYLRERADEGWIIDLSPEGHQPDAATRVFPDVRRQLCIGIFARYGAPNPAEPARVRYVAIKGRRTNKLDRLRRLTSDDPEWAESRRGWISPFLPATSAIWEGSPMLGDLIPWASPGVKPNRTWVYAVDDRTLRRRWERLLDARLEDKSLLFKETRDRTVQSRVVPLYQHVARAEPIAECNDLTPEVTKIAYRSFDRQWLVLDARVIDRIRPELWWSVGSNQIFASELHTAPIASGPAITFSALVPDMHNYRGNLGGRVLPLFRDSDGKTPNLAPGLLTCLSEHFQQRMTAEDVWAYVAAVVAHSGFSVRFREELSTPGIHVPMTKDKLLWNEAVEVGRRVLWLHTYGERFVNPPLNRPQGPPRMADPVRPRVVRAIPFTPDDMPNEIEYDEASRTLNVGAGQVAPVPPAVWHYDVGGMRVVRKWFSYRRREPHVRRSSDLNDVKPAAWDAEFTTDLLQVLNVLGLLVDLEPDQADVLKRVCAGPLITVQQLEGRGVIPVPRAARRPPSRPAPGQQDLRL